MESTFTQQSFDSKTISPKIICDTVSMIGFGCQLLGMTEISPDQRKNLNQDGASLSDMSLDSARIRGDGLMEEDEDFEDGRSEKFNFSGTKLNKVIVSADLKPRSSSMRSLVSS